MSNAKAVVEKHARSGSTTKKADKKGNFSVLSLMQNIGKSLVFPIATLPAAALLLRVGDFIVTQGAISGD